MEDVSEKVEKETTHPGGMALSIKHMSFGIFLFPL